MLPVWVSLYVCSLSGVYACPSWPPTLGQWKTFLLCAFGLCGRGERLIVLQAHRRRAHSCHAYTQNTHGSPRQSHKCTYTDPSQSPITRATDTSARTLTPSNARAHTRGGLARGQRVRRVRMDEGAEGEPGKRWSYATHTASRSVPGSRAENKSGPTYSIWPTAPPDAQPGNSWLDQLELQISGSHRGSG